MGTIFWRNTKEHKGETKGWHIMLCLYVGRRKDLLIGTLWMLSFVMEQGGTHGLGLGLVGWLLGMNYDGSRKAIHCRHGSFITTTVRNEH